MSVKFKLNNKIQNLRKKFHTIETHLENINKEIMKKINKNETNVWICVYCKVKYLEKNLPKKNCPYCLNEIIIPLYLYNRDNKNDKI